MAKWRRCKLATFSYGKMRGVPARWGDPARGIPTLLDPVQAEEHHEPGPLKPPPSSTSLGRGKGQGVPAREGVQARGFLELWAVWAWEYHEPGPPNGPGPLASPDLSDPTHNTPPYRETSVA